MNAKEHYKMYKDGKHWVFAAITVAAIGLGTAMSQETPVHADTTPTITTQSSSESTTSGNEVALPSTGESTADQTSGTSASEGTALGDNDNKTVTNESDDKTNEASHTPQEEASGDSGETTDNEVVNSDGNGQNQTDTPETAPSAGAVSSQDDVENEDQNLTTPRDTSSDTVTSGATTGGDDQAGQPAIAANPASSLVKSLAATVPVIPDTSNLTYSLNSDGTATITGAKQDVGDTLVIPSTITDDSGKVLQVTAIGQGFSSNFPNTTNLKTLIIENGITSIADNAFSYLKTLKTIDLSQNKTLKTIGKQAFLNDSITTLILPDSVTTIGDQAFASNPLANVTFGTGVQTIGNEAFEYDPLTSIDLSQSTGLTSIGDLAFFAAQATTVTLPVSLQTIGKQAFASNSKLTSIAFPASLQSIGDEAFLQDSQLATVTFAPNGQLTTIGSQAFTYDALTSLTLPASLQSIGASAFAANTALTAVNFAADGQLTTIGDHAFENDNGITTLTLPASLTTVGDFAFSTLHNLETVTFASGSQPLTIGNSAFIYDISLTQVTLPENLISIGDQAFLSATSLPTIVLPAQLESIGTNAFTYDQGLKTVDMTGATSLTTIGNGAFEYAGLTGNLTLPANLTTIGDLAFAVNNLTGVAFNDKLQSIGESAFVYNQLADPITLPATLTNVGDHAFYGNRLTTVTVPPTVTQLGTDVFSYNRLTQLTAAAGTSNLALNQNAYYFADQPTVSLNDLFKTTLGTATIAPGDISHLSNGVTLGANGTFVVPTGVDQFTFNWSMAGGTYTGQYQVVLNNPDIKVFNSTIFYGDDWTPADNLLSAIKPDGSTAAVGDLTVTIHQLNSQGQVVTDNTGKPVEIAPDALTNQAGTYQVTYSYGSSSSAVALVTVNKRAASYTVTGSQTVTYNGQAPAVDSADFNVALSNDLPYTLKDGDLTLAYTDAKGNQVLLTDDNAADFTNVGTYQVVVNPDAWARLTAESPALANYDWSKSTSLATLTIAPAPLTVTVADQSMVYGSQEPQPQVTVVDANGQLVTNPDITVTRDGGNDAGVYGYHVTVNNANYTLAEGSSVGTLTIEKLPLTITLADQSKAVGTADPTIQPTIVDSNGRVITDSGLTVSREPGQTVGTYNYYLNVNGLNANYTVAQANLGKLTILPVKATLTGSNYTMTVGDPTPTAADFKAAATDTNGQAVGSDQVSVDLGNADVTKPGTYQVTLRYGDAPDVTVTLTVVAKPTDGGAGDGGNPGGGTTPVDPTDPTDPTDPVAPVDPSDPHTPEVPDTGNHHQVISDGGVDAKIKPGIVLTVNRPQQLRKGGAAGHMTTGLNGSGQNTIHQLAQQTKVRSNQATRTQAQTARAATLPQTSEATTPWWSVLGIFLGSLGLVGYRKRRHD
ncbi:leucine-rich repeat protein [Levilactobacillus tujiorum]|uniref:Leucine-rich repeat protein n=1 Tax=Levilactobacillus tujiorum TaxID=2912243 RepID=A0ABX1L6S8_9LACO|nr:leucine-rich repeat protein [Levilactobacillus tujiorum]MCH5465345.1 leucine-rich repeat protein [Levilactobacillus tujiorum]NLR12905.1 leucine-rich repeat protein [Lactobacillus sp. HBUAS51387]NLR30348.1 leucine-rich repeat protein [Levilactobacillus tujiorum]